MSSGAIFGEAALISEVPRTANIVAKNDVEVLIVTQETLKKTMATMPEIMVKVMFNLAAILSERLQEQTALVAREDPRPQTKAPAS